MKKVILTTLMDYIQFMKDNPKIASIDETVRSIGNSEEENEHFLSVMHGDNVAIISKNPSPSIFKKYGIDGNFTITLLTVSRLNFAFITAGEIAVLCKE